MRRTSSCFADGSAPASGGADVARDSGLVVPRVGGLLGGGRGGAVVPENGSRRLGPRPSGEEGSRASQQGGERRQEAPSEAEEDRDDDRAVERLTELAAPNELLVDVAEDRRPDRRPEERPQPAKRDEHEHADVYLIEGVRVRGDEPVAVGEESPRQADHR